MEASSQRHKGAALVLVEQLIPSGCFGWGGGDLSRSAHWEEKDVGNKSRLLSYGASSIAIMLSELLH